MKISEANTVQPTLPCWVVPTAGSISIELKCFAIAGADKKFVWAKAQIKGAKVIVWNDEVYKPVAVRCAWADNPEGANLTDTEGNLVSPFRTDSW